MLLRSGDEGRKDIWSRICQRECVDVGCGDTSVPVRIGGRRGEKSREGLTQRSRSCGCTCPS